MIKKFFIVLLLTSSFPFFNYTSSRDPLPDHLLLFAYQDLAHLENRWLEIENELTAKLETTTNEHEKQKILMTLQEQQEAIEQEIEEVEALIEQLKREKELILNPPPPSPKEIEKKDDESFEHTINQKITNKISLREQAKNKQLLYQPKRNRSPGSTKKSSPPKTSSTPSNIKHTPRPDPRFQNSRVERKTTSTRKRSKNLKQKNSQSSRKNRPQKQNAPAPSSQNFPHPVFHRGPKTS